VSHNGKLMLFRSTNKSKFSYTLGKFTFNGFVALKSFNLIKVLEKLALGKNADENLFEFHDPEATK